MWPPPSSSYAIRLLGLLSFEDRMFRQTPQLSCNCGGSASKALERLHWWCSSSCLVGKRGNLNYCGMLLEHL